MERYARFHLNGGIVNGRRLLRKDLMEQYHSIQFPSRGQRSGYCLGLFREVVGKTFSLYHEGGGRGFGSHMVLFPELGFSYVVLTNREYHGITGGRGRSILNGPVFNRFGPTPIAAAAEDRMQKLNPGDARLKPLFGRYGDSPAYTVGFENGVLGLRMSENRFLPLAFYEDKGRLVGMYGATHELRFLPPYADRPGAMMIVNRIYSNHNLHYRDFNDSLSEKPGPDKPGWRRFLGEYDVIWDGVIYDTAAVTIKNGFLYYKNGKCEELEPGVFFRYDGRILDLGSTPPTFDNSVLRRKKP
jgi:hypothetical protein